MTNRHELLTRDFTNKFKDDLEMLIQRQMSIMQEELPPRDCAAIIMACLGIAGLTFDHILNMPGVFKALLEELTKQQKTQPKDSTSRN